MIIILLKHKLRRLHIGISPKFLCTLSLVYISLLHPIVIHCVRTVDLLKRSDGIVKFKFTMQFSAVILVAHLLVAYCFWPVSLAPSATDASIVDTTTEISIFDDQNSEQLVFAAEREAELHNLMLEEAALKESVTTNQNDANIGSSTLRARRQLAFPNLVERWQPSKYGEPYNSRESVWRRADHYGRSY